MRKRRLSVSVSLTKSRDHVGSVPAENEEPLFPALFAATATADLQMLLCDRVA